MKIVKGSVVLMKKESGLVGYGNYQCVSWVSDEIGELSLYGHNEHYKNYDVEKIIESPLPEKWVSVEDRLPKEGERVFIYYKNEHGKYWRDIAFYTYGGIVEFDDEQDNFPECLDEEKGVSFLPKGFWFSSEVDENLFNRLNTTHWQPLPSAPSEKGSEETNKQQPNKQLIQ